MCNPHVAIIISSSQILSCRTLRAGPRLRPRERRPTARTPTGNARATPASKKEKAESRPLRGTAALSSISTPGPLWSPSPAPWRTSTQRRAVPPWTPWRCPKPPAGGRVRGGAAHRAGSNAANPKRPTANRRTSKPCALPVHPALSATTRVERPRTRTLEALYPDWRGSVISHYICIFFKLTTQGYLYFCIVSVWIWYTFETQKKGYFDTCVCIMWTQWTTGLLNHIAIYLRDMLDGNGLFQRIDTISSIICVYSWSNSLRLGRSPPSCYLTSTLNLLSLMKPAA